MIPLEGEDLADVAKPGWIPLVILAVMLVAVFFLWRSLRKMLMTMDPDLPRKADLEGGDGFDDAEAAPPVGKPDGVLRKPARKPVSPAASPISPDVG